MYSVVISYNHKLKLVNTLGDAIIDIQGKTTLDAGPVRIFDVDPAFVVFAVQHSRALSTSDPVMLITDGAIVSDSLPRTPAKSRIPGLLAAGLTGYMFGQENKESS